MYMTLSLRKARIGDRSTGVACHVDLIAALDTDIAALVFHRDGRVEDTAGIVFMRGKLARTEAKPKHLAELPDRLTPNLRATSTTASACVGAGSLGLASSTFSAIAVMRNLRNGPTHCARWVLC